jgi:GDP-4-dehydro-6-deoxy-D-mannose reductase
VKVLITGSTGFVGRWLVRELEAAGHRPVSAPDSSHLDIRDSRAVAELLTSTQPDAVAHLAGIAFGPDARLRPDLAFSVNEGGTRSVMSAAAESRGTPVLVVSSAEVYGTPAPTDLPLGESAPLLAEHPYGLSKLAQERVVLESGGTGPPSVIVRPFNHTGPGQRLEFVVPALARRVLAARQAGTRAIIAGNIDVRRDFSDVRDVVRAYRLILEALVDSGQPGHAIYNVASGRTVAIRDIAHAFASLAGIDVEITIDPELVRESDPAEIRGDASLIGADLGWHPSIPFDVTIRDVFDDVASRTGFPAS